MAYISQKDCHAQCPLIRDAALMFFTQGGHAWDQGRHLIHRSPSTGWLGTWEVAYCGRLCPIEQWFSNFLVSLLFYILKKLEVP